VECSRRQQLLWDAWPGRQSAFSRKKIHEKSSQESREEDREEEMTPEEINACERDKIALLIDARDAAAKQYEDYSNAFVNLDNKASAVATIAGIVLAAVVAFLKDGQAPAVAQGNCFYMIMIVASPVLALAAIVFSMIGAKVTEVVEPFDAPERMREAKNLAEIDCDEFSRQHIIDYYRAQVDYWSKAIEDIRKVVATKANVCSVAKPSSSRHSRFSSWSSSSSC
jgi:hypothetical protein